MFYTLLNVSSPTKLMYSPQRVLNELNILLIRVNSSSPLDSIIDS
nr:hypothetical protein [Borreliella garinii]